MCHLLPLLENKIIIPYKEVELTFIMDENMIWIKRHLNIKILNLILELWGGKYSILLKLLATYTQNFVIKTLTFYDTIGRPLMLFCRDEIL